MIIHFIKRLFYFLCNLESNQDNKAKQSTPHSRSSSAESDTQYRIDESRTSQYSSFTAQLPSTSQFTQSLERRKSLRSHSRAISQNSALTQSTSRYSESASPRPNKRQKRSIQSSKSVSSASASPTEPPQKINKSEFLEPTSKSRSNSKLSKDTRKYNLRHSIENITLDNDQQSDVMTVSRNKDIEQANGIKHVHSITNFTCEHCGRSSNVNYGDDGKNGNCVKQSVQDVESDKITSNSIEKESSMSNGKDDVKTDSSIECVNKNLINQHNLTRKKLNQITNAEFCSRFNDCICLNEKNKNIFSIKGDDTNTYIRIPKTPLMNLPLYDQQLLKTIGQYLTNLGFDLSFSAIQMECGYNLENPSASSLRECILSGKWDDAIWYIKKINHQIDDKSVINKIKLHIYEEKYIEHVLDKDTMNAFACLRNQMTPLGAEHSQIHFISQLLMVDDSDEILNITNRHRDRQVNRIKLLNKINEHLPSIVMINQDRLKTLIHHSYLYQKSSCIFHNKLDSDVHYSLLDDHICTSREFPTETQQVLTDHQDEVWVCKFSPNGKKLASGSKDGVIIIWNVDITDGSITLHKKLETQDVAICQLSWSFDSEFIVVCGTEESPDVWVYTAETGDLRVKLWNNADDSLTTACFLSNNKEFVVGGTRGQFYKCNLNGTIIDHVDGVRIHCLGVTNDGKSVIASDTHKRVKLYHFDPPKDEILFREDYDIMSFCLSRDNKFILLNVKQQGLHLWDMETKTLIRKFRGLNQTCFRLNSVFGGKNDGFICSGSEDNKVYIWNFEKETPISKLEGHSRAVNWVDWNPLLPKIIASASDDRTIRIWGPQGSKIDVEMQSYTMKE
ncbi:WD repeat-containing protein 26 [Intoshia linei]|uniref:WD repeat-containing protein 26 n=1 Tax=Intoshia linei TaxID=1819745 RepID=A0A177BEF2_9BILA|nr:WD repeat-containing protein 26 [Intoshia linei]